MRGSEGTKVGAFFAEEGVASIVSCFSEAFGNGRFGCSAISREGILDSGNWSELCVRKKQRGDVGWGRNARRLVCLVRGEGCKWTEASMYGTRQTDEQQCRREDQDQAKVGALTAALFDVVRTEFWGWGDVRKRVEMVVHRRASFWMNGDTKISTGGRIQFRILARNYRPTFTRCCSTS